MLPMPWHIAQNLQERKAMTPEEGGEFVKMLRTTFSQIAVSAQCLPVLLPTFCL